MDSHKIIKELEADGWELVHVHGDHYQFRHPVKKGKVTVPHPVKDLPAGTVLSIQKQSGLKLTP